MLILSVGNLLSRYRALPVQIKASFWFLICAFLQKGISVITTPIFTRIMTPAEYGGFAVFCSWLDIISIIITVYIFGEVYILGLVKFENIRNQFTSSMQGLCLTLILIWSAVYFIFRDFWNGIFSLTTLQMTAMFIIVWTSSIAAFWASEQRVDYKYTKLVAVTLFASFLSPAVGIYLVIHSNDKVTVRILGLAAVNLIIYIWIFFAQMLRGRKFFSLAIWKYAIIYNLPLLPHYLSSSILRTSDRIMIEKMTGASQAGIYSLACSISFIMMIFNTALYQTIQPWLYKKIKARDVSDLSRVTSPALILIALVNTGLMFFAPEIVTIFAPKAYHNAVWIIPPVAISTYFMFTFTLFTVFQFYYEKTYLVTVATLLSAFLNLILNYIFIGIFGYYAAAYTTLLCYTIFSFTHLYFTNKICRIYLDDILPYDIKVFLRITLSFVLIGFVILLTYSNFILRYILIFIILSYSFIKRKCIISAVKSLINVSAKYNTPMR